MSSSLSGGSSPFGINGCLVGLYSNGGDSFVTRLQERFFGHLANCVADLLAKLGIAAMRVAHCWRASSTLARYHFDPAIRNKLLFVRNEVEQGADTWQSMATVGLLSTSEVLIASDQLGNRPGSEKLAYGERTRTARRLQGLRVCNSCDLDDSRRLCPLSGFNVIRAIDASFRPPCEIVQ